MPIPHKQSLPSRKLLFVGITLGLLSAQTGYGQDAETVEEVVVTGSFIRNSSFNGASPIDVQTQEQLFETGSISTGQFMRDLVYTDNIDAVSNVLGGPGGAQDGNTSGFNLRGLGDSSTLTLFDGRRHVNTDAIGSVVPDIALNRFEIVLDGAAALYGSDAVAGVVNIIPIKSFDGVRTRTSYGRDDEGRFEEYSVGVLFGKEINNFDVVAAYQYKENTPLMRAEQAKFLGADNDIFTDGPPGTFRNVTTGATVVDPSCGTFGMENNDKSKFDSYPSGVRLTNQPRCAIFFGQWIQYNRPLKQDTFYTNVTHDTTDWLTLEYQLVVDSMMSTFITETSSPMNSGRAASMLIPANHPANPIRQPMVPIAYRTFNGRSLAPQPHYTKSGSQWDDTTILTDRHSFMANYELGGDWSGTTSLSYQTRRVRYESYEELANRVQAALRGQGGPNGNEWFNPFMSSDSRSPFFIAGVTENSQQVVDWLSEKERTETNLRRYRLLDSFVTGPVAELPAGPLQMAFGVQLRDTRVISRPIKANAAGNNFNGTTLLQKVTVTNDLVRSTFLELEVPILHNLSAQIAARFEKFEDLNLHTTTPKVAIRYQPLEDLALRASWGQGFLAPDATQVGPLNFNSCASTRDGEDLLTATSFIGVDACTTTSPNLDVERSELWNVGFTWEPESIDGLSLSLDYQEIRYTGRIFTLNNQDIGTQDFQRVLAGIGATPATFSRTPGSPTWEAAKAFVAANPSPNVLRDPVTLRPTLLIRTPQNVDQLELAVYDMKGRYRLPFQRFGNLTLTMDATYIDNYLLTEFDGSTRQMGGYRNGDTGKAPPLPAVKVNLGLNWLQGKHNGRLGARYVHDMRFGLLDPITRVNPPLFTAADIVRPTRVRGGWRMDVNYGYSFDDVFGFGSGATVGINLRNIFDWEPQRLPVQGGLETRVYDPYGRMVTVSVDFSL